MINTPRYIVSRLKYVQETAYYICSINVKDVSMSVTDEHTHNINLFKLILINFFIAMTSSGLISLRLIYSLSQLMIEAGAGQMHILFVSHQTIHYFSALSYRLARDLSYYDRAP